MRVAPSTNFRHLITAPFPQDYTHTFSVIASALGVPSLLRFLGGLRTETGNVSATVTIHQVYITCKAETEWNERVGALVDLKAHIDLPSRGPVRDWRTGPFDQK